MTEDNTVYTHGHHESVLRSHSWRTAANSAAYLLDSLRPGMRILDIGCGPGTITVDLAKLVPQGFVTGLENAPEVLEQARATASAQKVDNIAFVVGDALALDFPDDSFDVTHAHQVMQHVGDPVQAFRELRRVTKPGGVVAARCTDFSAMTWYPEVKGMEEWQSLYLRVARSNGGEPNSGRQLHAWAHRAGIERSTITSTAGTWCYATPEERAWWSGLWADRIVASSFARTAKDAGLATDGPRSHCTSDSTIIFPKPSVQLLIIFSGCQVTWMGSAWVDLIMIRDSDPVRSNANTAFAAIACHGYIGQLIIYSALGDKDFCLENLFDREQRRPRPT